VSVCDSSVHRYQMLGNNRGGSYCTEKTIWPKILEPEKPRKYNWLVATVRSLEILCPINVSMRIRFPQWNEEPGFRHSNLNSPQIADTLR